MSIRLDWDIESERQHIRQESGEDPQSRRQRRRRRLRLLLIPLALVLIVAALAGFVLLRLRDMDRQIEQNLRDTVNAEVTSLRLGDQRAFLDMQRSATNDWLNQQADSFSAYQQLKFNSNVTLDGQIMNVTIEGTRARVQVRELIDAVPYVRTWFYWDYQDLGWRHVPPDYTFWGAAAQLQNERLDIRYQGVDAPLAQSLFETLDDWLTLACGSLDCTGLAPIQIEILPDPGLQTGWSDSDPWLLQLRSPYVDRARVDVPFDFGMRFELANVLAERLVSVASQGLEPVYPADAFYLRSTSVSWLVGRLANIDTHTFMMSSFANLYGDAAVGQLLSQMQPESGISLLYAAAPALDATQIDWRDFFTWRLALENELIQRPGRDALPGTL